MSSKQKGNGYFYSAKSSIRCPQGIYLISKRGLRKNGSQKHPGACDSRSEHQWPDWKPSGGGRDMSEEVEDTPPHQSGICQNLQNRVWLKPLSPSSLPSLSSQIKYPFFFFFLRILLWYPASKICPNDTLLLVFTTSCSSFPLSRGWTW